MWQRVNRHSSLPDLGITNYKLIIYLNIVNNTNNPFRTDSVPVIPVCIPGICRFRWVFRRNGITIWLAPVPNLIPPEFPESTIPAGFRQESVGDSKVLPAGEKNGVVVINHIHLLMSVSILSFFGMGKPKT